MARTRLTADRVVRHARWRVGRVRKRVQNAYYRRRGLTMSARGLRACGCSSSDRYVFTEIFGAEDAYRLDELLPLMQGGTVLEIGAHKGYFTILAGSTAERVVVFEPDERNHGYVLRNVAMNGFDNVTAVRAAVTDRTETRSFTLSAITDARHTFFRGAFSGTGTSVDVPCVSLPEALEQYGIDTVDVLKLDCEGSEYDVLLPCDGTTLGRIRCIVAELHESPTIPHARAELIGHLADHGFTAEVYDERARQGMSTCMALFERTASP